MHIGESFWYLASSYTFLYDSTKSTFRRFISARAELKQTWQGVSSYPFAIPSLTQIINPPIGHLVNDLGLKSKQI